MQMMWIFPQNVMNFPFLTVETKFFIIIITTITITIINFIKTSSKLQVIHLLGTLKLRRH